MVAVLGRIPPDVRAALDGEVSLLEAGALAALDGPSRAGIGLGLTSAMGGGNAETLDKLPGLRAIASVGAGTDAFDLADLSRRGIALCPTPDVMTEDTAECAVGLVIALLRNVVGNDRFVRRGDWVAGRAPLGWRVSGRRIGVVGLGRIGARVAEKLAALGCVVSYTGRSAKAAPWTFVSDVARLADAVDVLVLTCAGGEGTRGLVGAEVLDRLGPDGFLVNVSRGSVVDEAALIAALEEGRIAGAALDVFENEPTPDPRFAELRTCILSPHAATFTRENRRDLISEIRRLLGLATSTAVSA
ncbi:NAD(P)-dependent oxidoreductase [Oceaniglobus roseus]|uniref:NAD(P)-dependent oxidoreductase n=1 Tax=Oceaniglobus roseus TaxID=1737570 RepID=UPI0012FFFA3F|nr:NAD(P)-dependent oxidoreductase [Kandeliimicrobium roseum]